MPRAPLPSLALPVAVLAGLCGALGGPWLGGHRDKPAKEPFGFALPDGFKAVPDDPRSPRRVWVHEPLSPDGLTPNVMVTHVSDMEVFDDAKLSQIASGMPAFFSESKVVWTEVRHAQVTRRDGAWVGLLEGENDIEDVHSRSLQLSFPDNTGVTLVTANFGTSEAAHWEPIFESTIEASRGLAIRGVKTPLWMRLAWGVGAALAAFLLVLFGARSPADGPPEDPKDPGKPGTTPPPPGAREQGDRAELPSAEEPPHESSQG
jgi:hypothetical protein